jgi:hypothetical protein
MARKGERINVYGVLARKPKAKKSFARRRLRQENKKAEILMENLEWLGSGSWLL